MAVSAVPSLAVDAKAAGERFRDRPAYAQRVLAGKPFPEVHPEHRTTAGSLLWALGGVTGAAAVALLALYRRRIPDALRRLMRLTLEPALTPLRAAHSGHVGDYVTWLTVGTSTLGALFAAGLR